MANLKPVTQPATATKAEPAVHFVLQGKGGVGKSLVASILAQYLMSQGRSPACVDTDPVNQTFTSYKALKASHIPLMDGSRIDERRFDALMEVLLGDTDGTSVIDNGAATFLPLTSYLAENGAVEMLRDAGRKVYVHSVVTGGQALHDTLMGFSELATKASAGEIVVWLNEFFGPIAITPSGSTESIPFTKMHVFEKNADKVAGLVTIRKRNADTFGKDVAMMAEAKLTFAEALTGDAFQIMARQRLKTVRDDLFAQLQAIGL